jgi:adenylate kinase
MSNFLIMLGPPGAGKGTQAKMIAEEFNLAHVSSGDLFREHLSADTELGKLAKTFMDKGDLVPDDVTISMIRERLQEPDCKEGAILDGFPRTIPQSDALVNLLSELGGALVLAPYITVPPETLVKRLSSRYTCREQGHIFNLEYNPPKVSGICDLDRSELYQRADDKPETVEKRIQVYLDQTAPLINHYRDKGLLLEVDGNMSIEEVNAMISSAVMEKIK